VCDLEAIGASSQYLVQLEIKTISDLGMNLLKDECAIIQWGDGYVDEKWLWKRS
jgi:hypothetical protein